MEIKRVASLTVDQFIEEFLVPGRPVIVTDAMRTWDLRRFTPSSLEKSFGNQLVQIYNDLFDLQTVDTLKSYLKANFGKRTEGQSRQYIRWYTRLKDVDFFWADEVFDALKDAWSNPYFLPGRSLMIPYTAGEQEVNINNTRFPYKGLFISGKGARTRLHKDPFNSNAILCQFYGEKKIFLYDPGQAGYLMNKKEFVDINNPDVNKFPEFHKSACVYEDVLSTGEVVFFPAGWFHDVTCVSDSISITWNFVHALESENLCSFIDQHRDDDQLEIVRFFLKERLGGNEGVDNIIRFLRGEKEYV